MINESIQFKSSTILEDGINAPVYSTYLGTESYMLKGKSKVVIEKLITQKLGNEVCLFMSDYLHSCLLDNVLLCNTRAKEGFLQYENESFEVIVNLQKANDYQRINKFFETVNEKLPDGGMFINNVETYETRKKKLLNKNPKPFNYLYYLCDFIWTRVFPKLKMTQNGYFKITKGYGRVLTKAEILGRLCSCGFEIVEEKVINERLYFVAKKTRAPSYDMNPSYGPIISLKRVGKNGKLIKVYKFRTMYPYSEYLQQYVFEKNDLQKGGKIKNDFRVSNEGRLLRKYWIDEIPMIVNLLKGEMKLIGGRPLSKHYFSLYPKELQQKRIQFKPGLVPPFYVDLPNTLDEIIDSEMRYLEAYEKNPILTDFKYFIKAFYNVLIKGKRSE